MRRSPTHYVLGMRVDATSYCEAIQSIVGWAQAGESRYVCVANVHMVMEAHDDPAFKAMVNAADLVTPDGMPLVWLLRRAGFPHQERVYGPELTLRLCQVAAEQGIPVGFYGGLPDTLNPLLDNLRTRFPSLNIVYAKSPPFRPLTAEEDEEVVREVRESGARILFVGLGCPKQERWMASHRGRVPAVMIGVGAAFDIHAGKKKQAPPWMQRMGMEWFFRLLQEPMRLWERYLVYNPRFVILVFREMWKARGGRK